MPVAVSTHSPCRACAVPVASCQCATTGFSGAPANCPPAARSSRCRSRSWPAQRRDRRCRRRAAGHPGTVRAQLRPAAAAQRQHHRVGANWRSPSGVSKRSAAGSRPSPASDGGRGCATPLPAQSAHPAAQQWRGLAVQRENPPGTADDRCPRPGRAPRRARHRVEIVQPASPPRPRVRGSAPTKSSSVPEWVRLSPPLPAIRNLRPTEPLAS